MGRATPTIGGVAPGQYFEAQPAVPSAPGDIEANIAGRALTLSTDRGVFSPRALDRGTAVLLRHLEPVPAGHLLDLGCGYGPLALALAAAAPEQAVWAVDINHRALELTRTNAERYALGNIRARLPDEVPDEVRFAGIYSNPPIRVGKATLHPLLIRWLDRLAPGGRARLVVQKHLGSDSLARWLAQTGYSTVRICSEQTYRVLEVSPRASAR